MSRLYAWIDSDTNKYSKTITGNEFITVTINWGSAGDSKRACYAHVSWLKGKEFPIVTFSKGDNIK